MLVGVAVQKARIRAFFVAATEAVVGRFCDKVIVLNR